MNFLAHLYLSGNNQKIMVGNFIGDFVKGKGYESFESGIKKGILLHRNIDAYTDQHPKFLESKRKLWDKYRHYSGVIVDMFYDHFLAANWASYHHLPLIDYTHDVYDLMEQHNTQLPMKFRNILPFIIKNNWLLNYAHKEGIAQALAGMARRTTFNSKMECAVSDLTQHYSTFQQDFEAFFPDVSVYAEKWLADNPNH